MNIAQQMIHCFQKLTTVEMERIMIFFKKKHVMILALMGIIPLTCNLSDSSEQKHTIKSFYNLIISEKYSEIPDSNQLFKIKPYISVHLQKLLVEARNIENSIAAEQTEPAPPFIEGSIFTSLFEGPDSLTGIKTDSTVKNAFLVELEYKNTADLPGADTTVTWNDRVFLIKENSTWVIDDIELLGNWDFAREDRVTSILKSVISMK